MPSWRPAGRYLKVARASKTRANAPLLVRRDFIPTFSVLQTIKDLRLILDAAGQLDVPLPATQGTCELMHSAAQKGWADEDYAAVIKVVESQAGSKANYQLSQLRRQP